MALTRRRPWLSPLTLHRLQSNRKLLLVVLVVSLALVVSMLKSAKNSNESQDDIDSTVPITDAVRDTVAAGAATATSGRLFSGERVRTPLPPSMFKFANTSLAELNGQSRRTARTQSLGCDKFAVVATTTTQPSAGYGLRVFSALDGDWCVLVVGDVASASAAELLAVRLSVWGGTWRSVATFDHTELGTYGRSLGWENVGTPRVPHMCKNIAYLYAIQHGARYIWDTDDKHVIQDRDRFASMVASTSTGTNTGTGSDSGSYAGTHRLYQVPFPTGSFPTFNPFAAFRPSTWPIWPRGLPLTHIRDKRSSDVPLVNVSVTGDVIGVVLSIAAVHPDTDALHALTMPSVVSFATRVPLLLPAGVFAPINALSTLFAPTALWMLFQAPSLHPRVADVIRGYIGQSLLWQVGLAAAVYPPIVSAEPRRPHGPGHKSDLRVEQTLYSQTPTLVEFLRDTWLPSAPTLPGQMEELFAELHARDFVALDDVLAVQHWLSTLTSVGYTFPPPCPIAPSTTLAYPHAPTSPSCPLWPDMELLLPIPPRDSDFDEANTWLLPSMRVFWPREHCRLMFLTDGEKPGVQSFARRLTEAGRRACNNVRVVLNEAVKDLRGHDRQQFLMFYADNYTTAEYVGFIDTDAVASQRVAKQDLFDQDGRPIVRATFGTDMSGPPGWWWKVPASTAKTVGQPEPFRCMSYFPVVIKVAHLREMREHIVRTVRATSFEEAFRVYMGNTSIAYSQFNIMCAYLWYHHQDAYRWYVTRRIPGYTWPIPPGAVASLEAAGVTEDMLVPRPNVMLHWNYEQYRHEDDGLRRMLCTGVCASMAPTDSSPAFCAKFDRGAVNGYIFTFESLALTESTSSAVLAKAQRDRQQQVDMCPHRWHRDAIAALRCTRDVLLTAQPGATT